ncbi:MAG TPA: efflux RND transporter periplasmic adaptor subunit, partial [Usitatibacter sp.]
WIEAKSITVVPSADPRTHSTQVRIDLPEDVRGVYPGVFARAHFVVGKAPRLMVPREAILRRSELVAVYVMGEGSAPQLRQVRLGSVSDERGIEVLAGLKPGERVALDPVRAGTVAAKG